MSGRAPAPPSSAAWPVVRPGTIAEQYYAALRDQIFVRAYQYLGAGELLPLVAFTNAPAEHLTVTVQRTHAPSYLVHLLVRRMGKAWKITALDRFKPVGGLREKEHCDVEHCATTTGIPNSTSAVLSRR